MEINLQVDGMLLVSSARTTSVSVGAHLLAHFTHLISDRVSLYMVLVACSELQRSMASAVSKK